MSQIFQAGQLLTLKEDLGILIFDVVSGIVKTIPYNSTVLLLHVEYFEVKKQKEWIYVKFLFEGQIFSDNSSKDEMHSRWELV